VTGHAPAFRLPAFAALHEREGLVVALFGGRRRHGGPEGATADPGFPVVNVSQREAGSLAASGDYRAVVAGTGGRVALPAAYRGARRARVPFVLWASLWAQPRSAAGVLGWPLMRHIYRHADAVATYGPHVSAYVRRHGARTVVEAPQAVDNEFWSAQAEALPHAGFQVLYAGRLEREKGVGVLLESWRRSGLAAQGGELVLAGEGPLATAVSEAPGARLTGPLEPSQLRNFYASADVVVLPSLRTAVFREPWGLVINEAMSQRTPVIATDATGAAAGGLVRDGKTGVVVPAGEPDALADALRTLAGDPARRAELGAAGAAAVAAHTPDAWAAGISSALAAAAGRSQRKG
jgi:glycosyltransferase involved in cell wall biosynthesis